jgi:nicotinamide-nucleotide adenylyltransferase
MTTNSIRSLRTDYSSALKNFIASSRTFEVLGTVPIDHDAPSVHEPCKTLCVLDSSFNPPTLAHLKMSSSALEESPGPSSRLLLLLATQNADKPSQPALFEDRLVMMTLLAEDLRTYLRSRLAISGLDNGNVPRIDIGVTKKPYFVDKAAAIEESGVYTSSLEQVHLAGFDTLIRIFNPKYYPPEHTLRPLEPFLTRHRLRVRMRLGCEWGGRQEQQDYLSNLAHGGKENEGAKSEWANRVQLVEGMKEDEQAVSSTKARMAASHRPEGLDSLVPRHVRDYIISWELYKDE